MEQNIQRRCLSRDRPRPAWLLRSYFGVFIGLNWKNGTLKSRETREGQFDTRIQNTLDLSEKNCKKKTGNTDDGHGKNKSLVLYYKVDEKS